MERMKEGCAFINMMALYHSEQTALITQSICVCRLWCIEGTKIKVSQFASRELFKLNGQIRQLCPQIQLTC